MIFALINNQGIYEYAIKWKLQTPLLTISCYSNPNPSTHYPGYTMLLSMVYFIMLLWKWKEAKRKSVPPCLKYHKRRKHRYQETADAFVSWWNSNYRPATILVSICHREFSFKNSITLLFIVLFWRQEDRTVPNPVYIFLTR